MQQTQTLTPTPLHGFEAHIIRLARRAAGLTQRALAAKIGVAQAYIAQVECNKLFLAPGRRQAVAEALNVSAKLLVVARIISEDDTVMRDMNQEALDRYLQGIAPECSPDENEQLRQAIASMDTD